MTQAGRLLIWWVDPWTRAGSPFGGRAGRILLVSALLSITVLPAMMWVYGLDGWLWPLTFSVVACAPIGVLAADLVAERLDGGRFGAPLRLAALLLGLPLGVALGYVVAAPMLPAEEAALLAKDFGRSMRVLGGVAAGMILAGSLVWYRAEAFRLQAAADRARFETLKAQMQPHFLFNALNSLKQLIAEDPARAQDAAQRLADLYRTLLEVSKHSTVPLREELAVVDNYLRIEAVRYGDRLAFAFDIEPGVEGLHVPSLVLQTLVENAVKHGIAKAREGGEVRVTARRSDGWLELAVSNTGAAWAAGADGSGLSNTRERLATMYGPRSGFVIDTASRTVRFAVSGQPSETMRPAVSGEPS